MPHCDVTAGHYYSQLMTTAHASCHWPAPARFTEHGQLGIVTCYRPASSPTGHAPLFCRCCYYVQSVEFVVRSAAVQPVLREEPVVGVLRVALAPATDS